MQMCTYVYYKYASFFFNFIIVISAHYIHNKVFKIYSHDINYYRRECVHWDASFLLEGT